MDSLRQRASTKAIATTSKKKAAGSDLSSTRGGSEERNSSVPAAGRGQKRGRDFDFDKVGKATSPFGVSSVSSRDHFLDHPDSPPGSPGPGFKRPRTRIDPPLQVTMPTSPLTICQMPLESQEAGSLDSILSPTHGSKLPSTTTAHSSPQSSTSLATSQTSPPSVSAPSHFVSPSPPLRPTTPVNSTYTPCKSPQNSSSALSPPPLSSDSFTTANIKIKGLKARRGRSNAFGRQGNDKGKGVNSVSAASAFYAPHIPGRDYYHGKLVNLMHLHPEYPLARIENSYWEGHPKIQKLSTTQEPPSRLTKRKFFQGQNPCAVLMIAGVSIEDEAFRDESVALISTLPARNAKLTLCLYRRKPSIHGPQSVSPCPTT